MFGQDDTQEPTTIEPTTDTDTAQADDVVADSGSTNDVPVISDTSTDETPVETTDSDTPAEEAPSEPEAEAEVATPAEESTPEPAVDAGNDDLLTLKKDALTSLAPLIDHLDQTPEEHFKTTMMLIQATDDSAYVKAAYDSAQKITDDGARAQALLDIVNEINYFTQQHKDDASE